MSKRLTVGAKVVRWLDRYYAAVCRKEVARLNTNVGRAVEEIDKQVGRAARYGCLNPWRKALIEDMYRYVNQHKWLPISYLHLFDDWVEEAICLRDGIF